ncbi:MAG TPA: integrase, partial [Sphingomicrobium sp.]
MRSLSKGLRRQPRKDGHFAAMPYAGVPAFIARLRERASVGRIALRRIRGATWQEVDLDADLWSVPAERMK